MVDDTVQRTVGAGYSQTADKAAAAVSETAKDAVVPEKSDIIALKTALTALNERYNILEEKFVVS